MSATKQVDVDGRAVTVRELTVGEVRDWVTEIESGGKTIDVAGEFVFEDCSVDDLVRMSDMPREAFDDLAPSQIEPIREAARALNPGFFRVRAAVAAAQASIARQLLQSPDRSSATPSPSAPTATPASGNTPGAAT